MPVTIKPNVVNYKDPTTGEYVGIGAISNVNNWEIINEVTLTEDSSSIVITTDSNGQPFKLKSMAFVIDAEPSQSTSGNTNAYVRMQPNGYISTINAVVRTTKTSFSGGFEVIAVGGGIGEGSMAKPFATGNSTSVYWNGAEILPTAKPYSEYFELYTTGTAKFGTGSALQLLGVRA